MNRLQHLAPTVALVATAAQTALVEDYARAAALIIIVTGVFALSILHISIDPQLWVIAGAVIGYFFGRVVSVAAGSSSAVSTDKEG